MNDGMTSREEIQSALGSLSTIKKYNFLGSPGVGESRLVKTNVTMNTSAVVRRMNIAMLGIDKLATELITPGPCQNPVGGALVKPTGLPSDRGKTNFTTLKPKRVKLQRKPPSDYSEPRMMFSNRLQ